MCIRDRFSGNPLVSSYSAHAQILPIPDALIDPPENPEIEVVNEEMYIVHETMPDGREFSDYHINGPSRPSTDIVPSETDRPSIIVNGSSEAPGVIDSTRIERAPLSGSASSFPSFDWMFGCGAVSAGIIAAYYDRTGYLEVYEGPTDLGYYPNTDTSWSTWSDGSATYPNNPLIASHQGVDGRTTRGSIDDYWVQNDSPASDPYITNGWSEHFWGEAIGDYTKTSQSAVGNNDGWSSMWLYNLPSGSKLYCDSMSTTGKQIDITNGMKEFYEFRGYNVNTCYNQRTDNQASGGFSFSDFQAEIDSGHPVLLLLEGHFMVGYGYHSATSTIDVRDTWDNDPSHEYTMPWGGSYDNRKLLAVGIIHLDPHPTNYQLTVNKSGTGNGTAISDPVGINLCSTCTSAWAPYHQGKSVLLTATPATGSTFSGWTGCSLASGYQCWVTMNMARTVTANFSTAAPTYHTLTVNKSGNGSGTVTSSPAGISCGSTCGASFAQGTLVTLTATPSSGSTFVGWSGACTGTGTTCQVTMSEAKTVTATFSFLYPLEVYLFGSGSGTITSNPAGINCSSSYCEAYFKDGTVVTLTATPSTGSTFDGWTGACTGTGTICQVTMTQARNVSATFSIASATNFYLDVYKSGNGSGTINSNPAGINCGSSCNASFTDGTFVTLTAIPDSGSNFSGWTGCDLATGNQCQVTMNQARSVTASFTLSSPSNYLLSVMKSGAGSGVVSSNPVGINCGATCAASYTAGTFVNLTATPDPGSNFSGWSGCDLATGNQCQVTMNQARSVTATFTTSSSQIFSDVPPSYWAYNWISRLYNAGITSGCDSNPLRYCPEKNVSRAEMAIFLERGIHGASYKPPAVGNSTGFNDVPVTYWAAAWIKQLAVDGITTGCGGGNYCPEAPVTRDQMALFLLRAKYGASYNPPNPLGSSNLVQDPGFEAFTPNPYWEEDSQNFNTPLCTFDRCGDGGGTAGPRTGDVWAWFGGTSNHEHGYLSQKLVIPQGVKYLKFYLWIGYIGEHGGPDDIFSVEMDGLKVFSTTAAKYADYPTYTLVQVDISAFADGQEHTLKLSAVTLGQIINFNVDDIEIMGSGTTQPSFIDVPLNHWAFAWIEKLYADGITSGISPGYFGPQVAVSRAQMAAFLVRIFNLP